MSIAAMNWALTEAPVENAQEHVVLIALADRANDDGTAAWPSQGWIAQRARCSTRTVRRYLKSMEDRGLIRRGDQSLVEHLRADSRPVVWDLNIATEPVDSNVDDDRSQVSGRSTGAERPDNRGRSGRTLLSYKPSLEPSCEPSNHLSRRPAASPTQRAPQRLGVVVSKHADERLDDLAAACRKRGLTARWDALKPEQVDAITALVETHGVDKLAKAAHDAHRPSNPTLYAQGYIGVWSALPLPRQTATTTWTSCGNCDEGGWVLDPYNELDAVVRCLCRQAAAA